MLFSTVFLYALFYERKALCRLGSYGEVDAASFRSASLRAQPRAQSSERGIVANCRCIKRYVGLLRDPDAMEQNSKLPCNRNNRSPSRVATAACTQAKTPPTQGRVFSMWSDDMVGALHQQLSQIAVSSLGDA